MKTLRKIVPFLLLATSAFSTTGCSMYQSDAADKSWFVGTYELDVYKSKKTMDSEEEPYDRKAEEGIKAYFTLDADGYGFYGYKDNATQARIDSVFSRYISSSKEPGKFEAINMNDGIADKDMKEWLWKVGCLSEPIMGFQYHEKKKPGISGFFGGKYMEYTLSYTIPQRHNNIMDKDIHYQYVSYKKISEETGLAPINKALGTSIKIDRPFELKQSRGCMVYRCQTKEGTGLGNKGHYEYAVLDMHSFDNGYAPLYYSLIDEPGQKMTNVSFVTNENGVSMKSTIFGKEFVSSYLGQGLSSKQEDYPEESDLIDESFSYFYGQDVTLAEVIERELSPSNY